MLTTIKPYLTDFQPTWSMVQKLYYALNVIKIIVRYDKHLKPQSTFYSLVFEYRQNRWQRPDWTTIDKHMKEMANLAVANKQ